MAKTILITGATDGIGLATAKALVADGHHVLIHGRTPAKIEAVTADLSALGSGRVDAHCADLSRLIHVERLADDILARPGRIDVLINNAGVFKTAHPKTDDGLDVRFAVNTLAPARLTERLLPSLAPDGRVINLASAAQAPVDPAAIGASPRLSDMDAYAQSKLALIMWTRDLAERIGSNGPVVVAVNPGSLLASKMVQQGFGVAGNDLGIGVDILMRAALSPEFADKPGQYFDNDRGCFGSPHPDALDVAKSASVVRAIHSAIQDLAA